MTGADAALLAAAGFLAGSVNAVAGGGSLISFPALLAVGYPALAANVTNTVAVWPGYVGGALGFRRDLHGQRVRVLALTATSVVGALAGAGLLLVLPDDAFTSAVPWLLLAAAGLLAAQPLVARAVRRLPGSGGEHRSALLHMAGFAAAAYGAFFGAGVSVIMLAVLGIFLHETIHRINALRSALVLLVNTVALVVFALFGPVAWPAVAVMATASLAGGWSGASVARRLDARLLRGAVVVFAVGIALHLVLQ